MFVISGTLITPPRTAPSANPLQVIAMSVARFRAGAYSATSAITLGMAPPNPMPHSSRRIMKGAIDGAKAEAILNAPNQTTQKARILLRPNLSPRYPNANAPAMAPSSTAENTGPKLPGANFHSATKLGAT
jgi:hypothetical protein